MEEHLSPLDLGCHLSTSHPPSMLPPRAYRWHHCQTLLLSGTGPGHTLMLSRRPPLGTGCNCPPYHHFSQMRIRTVSSPLHQLPTQIWAEVCVRGGNFRSYAHYSSCKDGPLEMRQSDISSCIIGRSFCLIMWEISRYWKGSRDCR